MVGFVLFKKHLIVAWLFIQEWSMPISMPTVVMLSTFHFNLLWLRAVQWDGATWRLMWLYTVHSPGCCAVPPCSGLVDGLPDVCQVPAVVLWAQCKNLFRTGKKNLRFVSSKKKAKTRIHVKYVRVMPLFVLPQTEPALQNKCCSLAVWFDLWVPRDACVMWLLLCPHLTGSTVITLS